MWFCSGNRDEAHFEDGDTLRIDRPNARRHLGYGFGIHRCLGSHVADMQLRILWEEILKRFTRIELMAEPKRLASNFSANYDEVLVRIPG
jgi:cytochrome P450